MSATGAGGGGSLAEAWESHSQEWIAWAGETGFDAFWDATWPELAAVAPGPGRLTVDLGCGEGRAGRQLAALGHRVVGIERAPSLARAAAAGSGRIPVALADARHLPLADGCADLVVASMVLLDLDDLSASVLEVARVLDDGGAFCLAVLHPFVSAEDPASRHTPVATVSTPYLTERRYLERIERDGRWMTFESMHRPLSVYVAALAGAGLAVVDLREHGTGIIPWLLTVRCERRAPEPGAPPAPTPHTS